MVCVLMVSQSVAVISLPFHVVVLLVTLSKGLPFGRGPMAFGGVIEVVNLHNLASHRTVLLGSPLKYHVPIEFRSD